MQFLSSLKKVFQKRTFFEGAKQTVKNRDFWNADGPFEQVARGERATLRTRARWLSENNAIMHNIDESILNNVIGTGITVQMRLSSKSKNDKIEKAFDNWAKRTSVDITGRLNWYEMQRVILKNRMVDGEVFIYMIPTNEGLKLQLLEPDALDVSKGLDGITYDKYGAPTQYHFKSLTEDGRYTTESKPLPAEMVIHFFKQERPTQGRGVSEYRQAILDIKSFSAFTSATIDGARARASIGYVVQTGGDISGLQTGLEDEGYSPYGPIEQIGATRVFYLRPGESISKTAPGSSDTEYNNFSEVIIRLIATARSVSYELAFKDFSKTNYSSSRASLMQDYKAFEHEQLLFTRYVYDRIFAKWLELEVLAGRVTSVPIAKYMADPDSIVSRKRYIFPKKTLIDPLKEALAFEKEVELNMVTQSELAQRNGQDFEEVIAKKAEERDILEKYGLTVDENGNVSDGATAESFDGINNEELREALERAANGESLDEIMLNFVTPGSKGSK